MGKATVKAGWSCPHVKTCANSGRGRSGAPSRSSGSGWEVESEPRRYHPTSRTRRSVDPLDSLRRRFRYHAWATATLVDALGSPAPDSAIRPVAHALTADRVWLLRLRGEPTDGVALWPDFDAAGCRALARRNAAAYADYLGALAPSDLRQSVRYATSSGATHETAVADVLDHVLLHAAHHRGQANAALRAAGGEPPHVDLIAWLRAGEPEP